MALGAGRFVKAGTPGALILANGTRRKAGRIYFMTYSTENRGMDMINSILKFFIGGEMKRLRFFSGATFILAVLTSSPAYADNEIYVVPTGWRLQVYVGGQVAAYFAGTSCFSGQVLMPPSATADEKNRFVAMVTTAKAAGKYMGVFYETASGSCQITSFYLQ